MVELGTNQGLLAPQRSSQQLRSSQEIANNNSGGFRLAEMEANIDTDLWLSTEKFNFEPQNSPLFAMESEQLNPNLLNICTDEELFNTCLLDPMDKTKGASKTQETCSDFQQASVPDFLDNCALWELEQDIEDPYAVNKVPEKATLEAFAEDRNTLSLWSSPMDFDDISKIDSMFKVDKSDIVNDPTLAELNANDESESVLDLLDVNDFFLESSEVKPRNLCAPSTVSSKSSSFLSSSVGRGSAAPNWNFVDTPNNNTPQLSELLSTPPMKQPPKGEMLLSALSSSVPAAASKPFVKQEISCSLPKSSSFLNTPATLTGKPSSGKVVPSDTKPAYTEHRMPVPSGKPKCTILAERLSCSAPVGSNFEHVWKQIKLEQGSEKAEPPKRHGSTDTTLSHLSSISLSMDDGFSSQAEDSDQDLSSDAESHGSDAEDKEVFSPSLDEASNWGDPDSPGEGKKKKRYFWQYNVQAKGPKGPRLSLTRETVDPHFLNDITDPVFSPDCRLEGVKHAGKARRGDGNDLTPNPRKLYNIGLELRKLSRTINDLTPVSELPFNARPTSRKEKNKLASRACRLKKKAQHEANKLKLYGMQQEHKKLINAITEGKRFLRQHVDNPQQTHEECETEFEALMKKIAPVKVAGHTAEFVNKVLGKVAAGTPSGGLNEL